MAKHEMLNDGETFFIVLEKFYLRDVRKRKFLLLKFKVKINFATGSLHVFP